MHLDLKTSYPNVSVRKYCINISATFGVMSTLAKASAIEQFVSKSWVNHLEQTNPQGKAIKMPVLLESIATA